jgi:hypothetical protein
MDLQFSQVLMLDFDGVLHSAQGNQMPEFTHAPRLSQILAESDCTVVISSTWREHYSLDELRAKLPRDLGEKVVGVLGPDQRGPHVRFKNIEAWLTSESGPVNWRALDDSASDFPPGCPQLILCDGRTGLGDAQEHELRKWLQDGNRASTTGSELRCAPDVRLSPVGDADA